MEQDPQLAGVRKLVEYRQPRAHIFPSDYALHWFARKHRAELIQAGALVMLAGQWLAVEDKFDAFVLEIGRREAQKRQGGKQ